MTVTGPAPRPRPEPRPPASLRVAAVDDHPLVVHGMLAVLQRQLPGLEWLGAATTAAGLVELLDGLSEPPDIVLIDLALGDGSDYTEVIADLTDRCIRAVIVTSERRPIPIRRAVSAGALGLVIKSDPPEQVAEVVREVSEGRFSVSSDLAHALVTDPSLAAKLAPREVEVLRLLAEGHTRREAARSFRPPLSESTVSTYLERIFLHYRLLGRTVRGTVDAVREATADGYVGDNGPH